MSDDAERMTSDSPAAVDITQTPVPPLPPRKRGGFGVLAGGALAALLGAGAAIYALPLLPASLSARLLPAPQVSEELTTLRADLAALTSEIEALKSAPVDTGAGDALAKAEEALISAGAAQSQLQEMATKTGQTLQGFDKRVSALEKRPAADGGVPAEALAAFQRDLDAVKAQVAQGTGGVDMAGLESAAKAAEDRIRAAQEETARLAAEAEATAKAAKVQATVAHVQAALNSGAPIAQPLADLTALGIAVPEALTGQGDGIPTLASLRADFPDAARAALRASLPETSGTGALERIGAFLQVQTGARSIEPREGGDPDAVLSRAEAQLSGGGVKEALAELAALPEAGRAAMADWIARAERRLAATEAVALLAQP